MAIIGGIAFALFLSSCHQNGTVFAVDTTDDTVDVNPGDGLCADANGDCSLRAAVIEANALPGVEEITLVDGEVYELTIDGALEDDSFTGDIDIRSAVVVTGDGTIFGGPGEISVSVDAPVGLTEFDGPNFNRGSRALEILNGSTVSVRHAQFNAAPVVMEDGVLSVWSSSFDVSGSGGIDAEVGTVRLENSTMHGSSRLVDLVHSDDAVVTVVSSTLSNGRAWVSGLGTGTIFVQSSIVDLFRCEAGFASLGHNLLSGEGCLEGEPGDVVGAVYPVAGELADNGGEILTLLPDPFGEAVDGGLATGCTLTGDDARGVERPFGPACDIGALELEYGADCAAPGPGADLRFCDFRTGDLAGLDLSGADATDANFEGADLTGAVMQGAALRRARLDEAVLDGADLTDADLSFSTGGFYADGVNFTRATLENAGVRSAIGADFTDANAPGFGTWAFTASIAGAHLGGADFTGGSFWGVTSGGLTGTATFPPGVGVIDGYLIDDFVWLDGVDFSGVDTDGISFTRVTIANSDLTGVRVKYSWAANYANSILDRTDWTDTYADNSQFSGANMVLANMTNSQAESTDWQGAAVIGVDFTDASLRSADFLNATVLLNTWSNTTCPSGVNSDDNGGSCDGQFTNGAPSVGGGAAVPAEFEGMSVEDFSAGGVVDE